ncbi:MAG: prephenate dehydratase [Burkholderiaceae bacterium]|jgi:chorismate mutase / prephenate dehydratase|uniref:prephenate dehydratase n=1 Tax=Polynucleobacter sp. HIN8 TaxID=3047867 RepID=UPI001DD3EC4E|nr:prephenate dehydratase [Polynucleobacter sp. HIN8]MBU6322828.1 prephenate dehydratase [Burkholderiales bacterium]NBO84842.1 prephenate dehydratase [Burkholderiaceae bacterium]NBP18892.1 prephenate dehydratase [Burkholderiaceae bacterium]NBP96801.1 prephenate dehydratase [Burkholderiaceae bacterium]NCA09898.1 prephenate dehydratase [Burkholderiaceae bacterium]
MSNDDQRLAPLRAQIDAIDQELLELISKRAKAAQEVGHIKNESSAPIFRPERENQVIQNVLQKNPGPLLADGLASIWREIMSACRALESKQTIAYLGPTGTFSEQAAHQFFGQSISGLPCVSLDEVFKAVEKGAATFGVVPVENSSEGAVSRTLDLLLESPLQISGEVVLPIRHHLLTKHGNLDGVKTVCAHAQALAQCQQWLSVHAPQLQRQAVSSNAEAARMASKDSSIAAIAGEPAQLAYGLQIVSAQIQDDPNNRTRFVVIGQYACQPCGQDQTSLVLSVANQPGAVHHLLGPLAKHGVSMTRFESRPARKGSWEYHFYIDIEGHTSDAKVATAIAELKTIAAFYKNLGSYPRAKN